MNEWAWNWNESGELEWECPYKIRLDIHVRSANSIQCQFSREPNLGALTPDHPSTIPDCTVSCVWVLSVIKALLRASYIACFQFHSFSENQRLRGNVFWHHASVSRCWIANEWVPCNQSVATYMPAHKLASSTGLLLLLPSLMISQLLYSMASR